MESASSYLFEFFIIFLLIFFNALFVATEYAIVRVRSSEIEALMKQGKAGVKDVKDIINNLDKYISSTQLGITIVNLLLGWIGEDIFVKLLHPLFAMTTLSKPIVNTLSVIIGLGIITYFTITIGELAPKAIAIKNYKKITVWFAKPLKLFYLVFKPFIWLLNKSANLILKMMGINPLSKDENIHSEEEIKFLISEGRKTGVIDSTEHQLIEKIFDFNDKTASEIMVPRNLMMAIDIDESRDAIIQKVIEDGYSRIPVYKDNIDNIIGIIYSKDLISAAEHKDIILLQDILRPVHFVPDNKQIGELLKEMQRKRVHLAIVVNEHGGVEGLITIEDIIEEIVGEIEDEYDVETDKVNRDKRGAFYVNPNITIKEFNSRFRADIPEDKEEYHTLSGFLQTVTGHIPDIYERINYNGLSFTIMKKSGNRLLQLKIQKI
ncbi:MAG: HlyC/CorC family transporter [Ignavibacteria bacterium]|nr:HlyC/CorC family transporter [Ignavibacteria bacterium]